MRIDWNGRSIPISPIGRLQAAMHVTRHRRRRRRPARFYTAAALAMLGTICFMIAALGAVLR